MKKKLKLTAIAICCALTSFAQTTKTEPDGEANGGCRNELREEREEERNNGGQINHKIQPPENSSAATSVDEDDVRDCETKQLR